MEIAGLLWAAEEAAETIQGEAKEILGLIGTPSGLVTGTFVVAAVSATKRSHANRTVRTSLFAVVAALAAVAMASVLVGVMWDVARRALDESWDPTLTIYEMAFVTAVGLVVYCALFVFLPAAKELQAAWQNQRELKAKAKQAASSSSNGGDRN